MFLLNLMVSLLDEADTLHPFTKVTKTRWEMNLPLCVHSTTA